MIKLRKLFKKGNREFQQLFRDDKMAIYKVVFTGDGGSCEFTEVFRIKVYPPNKFHPESFEKYPNDESFGSWAWCCSSLPSLKKILKQKFDIEIANIPADFSFLPSRLGAEGDDGL